MYWLFQVICYHHRYLLVKLTANKNINRRNVILDSFTFHSQWQSCTFFCERGFRIKTQRLSYKFIDSSIRLAITFKWSLPCYLSNWWPHHIMLITYLYWSSPPPIPPPLLKRMSTVVMTVIALKLLVWSICSERWKSIRMLSTCSHQCWPLVQQRQSMCLCDNACKRFLAICRKSRALWPISRLLSVPI